MTDSRPILDDTEWLVMSAASAVPLEPGGVLSLARLEEALVDRRSPERLQRAAGSLAGHGLLADLGGGSYQVTPEGRAFLAASTDHLPSA